MNWQDIPGWFDETDAKCYETIVENTPTSGRIVEIGCLLGRSSCCLLEAIKKTGKFIVAHFVDSFVNIPQHDGIPNPEGEAVRSECVKNLAATGYHKSFVHLWIAPSVKAAKKFKKGSIDAVFIDGAHDYDSVVADIKAWRPKVRKGGIVAGHDYNFPDVLRAIGDTITTPVEQIGFCWLTRV